MKGPAYGCQDFCILNTCSGDCGPDDTFCTGLGLWLKQNLYGTVISRVFEGVSGVTFFRMATIEAGVGETPGKCFCCSIPERAKAVIVWGWLGIGTLWLLYRIVEDLLTNYGLAAVVIRLLVRWFARDMLRSSATSPWC